MDKERIKALSDNIRDLLGHYDQQQATTAKLFKICLEFLEDKKTGHEWGGGMQLAISEAKKRRERKQQLIAAIKGYIKMINEREKKDEKQDK